MVRDSLLTLDEAINISVTLEMVSEQAQALLATGRVYKQDSGQSAAQGAFFSLWQAWASC